MTEKIKNRPDVDQEHILKFPDKKVTVYFTKERNPELENHILAILLDAYRERMRKLEINS